MKKISYGNIIEKIFHVLAWAFLFCAPIFMMDRSSGSSIDWVQFLRNFGGTFCLFVLFYANYFWLVPKYFLKNRRGKFLLINLALCAVCLVSVPTWDQLWRSKEMKRMEQMWKEKAPQAERKDSLQRSHMMPPSDMRQGQKGNKPHRPSRYLRNPDPGPFQWIPVFSFFGIKQPIFFFIRDLISQLICIFIAIMIRMNGALINSERARKEAEYGRTEAELKNLRSQINPHFLLNTLNNIYALILFDQDKAQEAVQDLSKLLRHVLYDNQQTEVTLESEVEFLDHYIDLMKIRQTGDTEVTFEKHLAQPTQTMVAPLLFISLVENAFKHGVRTSEPSFIHIQMKQEDKKLSFEIENSNFPKDEADHSGSGIGLEQVQKRLDLLYGGKYNWEKGVKDDTYFSKIEINL